MDKFAIFEKMTKRQIINWIRNNMWMHHNLPKESDLLWEKYLEMSDEALKQGERHVEQSKVIAATGWSTKYDTLAKKFNASEDLQEKIDISKEMSRLRKPWDDHRDDYKRIDKLHEDAEKVLLQYEKARLKENGE